MDIGSKGLSNANLILPQSTSLTFFIVHKDDHGRVVDHSDSTPYMRIQSKDGQFNYPLDSCCTCGPDQITITIPPADTAALPLDKKLVWDIMLVTSSGECVRACYGDVQVVDTYARDGS